MPIGSHWDEFSKNMFCPKKDTIRSMFVTAKKSFWYAYSLVGGISIFAGLLGWTIRDFNNINLLASVFYLIGCFTLIFAIIFKFLYSLNNKPYKATINGKLVNIKVGDLFAEEGWKVIPFNDRFDTKVDDVMIAHNTLNGKMIDYYVGDLDELNNTIEKAANESSSLEPKIVDGKKVYPLGRLIAYKDFLMLAFTHFDKQNVAYIYAEEYEQMLMRMWKELRRIYAAKPISIPLIGTGITTIKEESEKNYTEILRCILCTLRRSNFQPDQGITIVLTEDAMRKIDMNIIREDF